MAIVVLGVQRVTICFSGLKKKEKRLIFWISKRKIKTSPSRSERETNESLWKRRRRRNKMRTSGKSESERGRICHSQNPQNPRF